MNNQPPETCYDCKLKDAELLRLREEAKMGNIPYREAIALKEENKRLREALEKLADPRSWFHIMNYDGVDASKSPITGWCDIGTEPDEIAEEALKED